MILSRTGYCPFCYKAGMPNTGNRFVVRGKNGYHFYECENQGLAGYVPHFYQLMKSVNGLIYFEKICAMENCGIKIYYNTQGLKFTFNDQWIKDEIPVKDWNALVLTKNFGYKI